MSKDNVIQFPGPISGSQFGFFKNNNKSSSVFFNQEKIRNASHTSNVFQFKFTRPNPKDFNLETIIEMIINGEKSHEVNCLKQDMRYAKGVSEIHKGVLETSYQESIQRQQVEAVETNFIKR